MGNSRSARRNQSRNQQRPLPPASDTPRSRWGRYALWAGGAAVLLTLVVYIVVDAGGKAPETPERPGAPAGTEVFEVADASHVSEQVDYPQDPPVGGPHSATDVPCGYYDTPLTNEMAVHTLEHGVVWITYSPDLAASEVSVLADKSREPKVLVSPYPGLDAPIVASAWGRQLRLDSAADERLDQFIAAFQGGAQSPEPSVRC